MGFQDFFLFWVAGTILEGLVDITHSFKFQFCFYDDLRLFELSLRDLQGTYKDF